MQLRTRVPFAPLRIPPRNPEHRHRYVIEKHAIASDSEVEPVAEIDTDSLRSVFHRIMTTEEAKLTHSLDAPATSEEGSASGTGKVNRSDGPSPSSHNLTVETITNLETQWIAELLVLNACETSAGRMTADGVLSVVRAFMGAGVPCVVASLWEVDDGATFALMRDFFEELRKGEEDVASALQSAILSRMENQRNAVQFWAPFNVWGLPSLRIPEELQTG